MSPQITIDMSLRYLENHGRRDAPPSETFAGGQAGSPARSQNVLDKLGIYRLICGGLLFIGLTVGIFWFQFSKIPAGCGKSLRMRAMRSIVMCARALFN